MTDRLRQLMVRMARIPRPSAQIAVDRGVHVVLRWILPPLFADPSHERPLSWHVASQDLEPGASIDVARSDVWQPVPVRSGLGRLTPHVRVTGRPDPSRPLVVWHHGAGEFPVDSAVANVWDCGGLDLPLALVRATAHHEFRSYANQMRRSDGAAAMLASSALAMEAVRRAWDGPIVIAGLSLGGMVALLHARIWGRAAIADGRPIRWASYAAGPDISAVIRRSAFRRLVCERTAQHRDFERILDLQDHPIMPEVARRIHPLLGQWDQVHRLRDQAAAFRAIGVHPEVAGRGHIGLSVDGYSLSAHLKRVLARLDRPA